MHAPQRHWNEVKFYKLWYILLLHAVIDIFIATGDLKYLPSVQSLLELLHWDSRICGDTMVLRTFLDLFLHIHSLMCDRWIKNLCRVNNISNSSYSLKASRVWLTFLNHRLYSLM